MRTGLVALALWALGCLLPAVAAAQSAPVPLRDLLAMPASPGSIGLLVEHTAAPAARDRIAAALFDTNPETRAAAARVAFVRMLAEVRPALVRALENETDPGAGREMVRAAVGIAPEADLRSVVAAAARIGGDAPEVLAEQLGRSLRQRAVAAAPALVPLHLSAAGWERLLLQAHPPDGGGALAAYASLALKVPDVGLWEELLLLSREQGRPVDPELLAAAQAPAFAEYLRRMVATRAQDAATADCRVRVLRDLLTDDERKAVKDLERRCRARRRELLAVTRLRTISGLPDGLLNGVLDSAGCELRRGGIMGGHLRPNPDGRPGRVFIETRVAEGGCGTALRALLSLTLTPEHRLVGDDVETVLVPTDPDQVACADRSASAVAALETADTPARLLPPSSASVASMRRVQESMTLFRIDARSLVSATGCTAAVEVLGTPPADIAAAFATALLRNRYEPARLHGRPVAVEDEGAIRR